MTIVAVPRPAAAAPPKKPDVRERRAPDLASAFVGALDQYVRDLPHEQLLLALAKLSPVPVILDLLDFKRLDEHLTKALEGPVVQSFKDGWAAEVKDVAGSPLLLRVAKAEALAEPDFAGSFNTVNPEAIDAARKHVGTLISQISDAQRENVRQVIGKGFTEGIPPRQLAQMVGASAGMTTKQLNAFMNYSHAQVEDAKKRYAPKPVPDLAQAQIEKRLDGYKTRLLRQRGLLIAQTETIAASNMGQHALWLNAIEQGYLGRDVQRRWITAADERPCPICFALNGQVVSMSGQFGMITGTTTMMPPAHPRCRCSTGLVDASARSTDQPVEPEPDTSIPGDPTDAEIAAYVDAMTKQLPYTASNEEAAAVKESRKAAVKEALDRGMKYEDLTAAVARRLKEAGHPAPAQAANTRLRDVMDLLGRTGPVVDLEALDKRLVEEARAPVSAALEPQMANARVRKGISAALDAIDSVHTDGDLPKIPLLAAKPGSSYEGAYEFNRLGAKDIRVKNGLHVELTVAHEVGHFLDHQVLVDKNRFSSMLAPASEDKLWRTWYDSVMNSPTVAALAQEPTHATGYRNYLLDRRELWARAYAQYIATKGASQAMKMQVKEMRAKEGILRLTQWDAKEFEPIAAAIEAILVAKGWFKP